MSAILPAGCDRSGADNSLGPDVTLGAADGFQCTVAGAGEPLEAPGSYAPGPRTTIHPSWPAPHHRRRPTPPPRSPHTTANTAGPTPRPQASHLAPPPTTHPRRAHPHRPRTPSPPRSHTATTPPPAPPQSPDSPTLTCSRFPRHRGSSKDRLNGGPARRCPTAQLRRQGLLCNGLRPPARRWRSM